MQRTFKLSLVSAILLIAMLACNLPFSATPEPSPTAPVLVFETPTQIPPTVVPPTLVVPTATQCLPSITTKQDSNVRNGPSQAYEKLGYLPTGATAVVAGKNGDGSWWYIQFAGGENGHGWISNAIVTANCIPATLAVIAALPLPVSQPKHTKTPKPSQDANKTPSPTSSGTPELLFKIDFDSVWYCGGSPRISAKIYNLGNVTIESVLYSVEAGGLYINGGTINSSPFETSATEPEPACAQNPGHGVSALAPGGSAFIPIVISSVPAAGTEGFLYVEACTEDQHKGTCIGQFVYFNF